MMVDHVSAAESRKNGHLAIDSAASPKRTGLSFPERMPFAAWERIGRQLSVISDASAWWLGDWLIYGERRYADRYKQAIAETSLDYQTLRNYAWVARKFPMSRRRDRLSLQHHAEVAALPEAEQTVWLDRAVQFRWSRNELRRQVRARRAAAEPTDDLDVVTTVRLQVASDREQRWQRAAGAVNCELLEWMLNVLDQAADLHLRESRASSRQDGDEPLRLRPPDSASA
jgi:hypothetical protein